jgi:hypothetical protein
LDLERAAADFAIGREPLAAAARIDYEVEALATERALDGFADFHGSIG